MASVLIVEDDALHARALKRFLAPAGHDVNIVVRAEDALPLIGDAHIDVIVTDLNLPGISGLEFVERLRPRSNIPVIVVTGDTSSESVIRAMRAGAADYITKPLDASALEQVLARVVEFARALQLEDQRSLEPDPSLTARSRTMRDTLQLARRCAESPATAMLLTGESGSGKEVIAAYIHRRSTRARGPFLRINMAAIPDTMVELHLFGATRGAFTDARADRQGIFAAANGGTLLLDEIGELRPELQAKLLRVIETRRFYPVGSTDEQSSDVRIIAATNRSPHEAVEQGQLRSDLYYRLATMVIRVPSLSERRDDIPLLASAMLSNARARSGRGPASFTEEALALLERMPWRGNVRELQNTIERLAILVDDPVIDATHVVPDLGSIPSVFDARMPAIDSEFRPESLRTVVERAVHRAEREHIATVLARVGGNRSQAARVLGVSRSTLWQKLRDYGLASD
jgi:two-component system, NtrC family, response regulator AtoC